jgi:nitrite reductase/ring-hydroxylating ferredoxin subunit
MSTREVSAGRVEDLARAPRVVAGPECPIAVFCHEGRVYAVDNRCPHLGFPLHRGSLHEGILTCHWHHARFDLETGGCFDLWADDVTAFPVEVRGGEAFVDPTPRHAARDRIELGLLRNIWLVLAKATLASVARDPDGSGPFLKGLRFGALRRRGGWSTGLTILTCLRNISPALDDVDRARATYVGLSRVARDCDGEPPRRPVEPLPGPPPSPERLARWLRRFVEVRDEEGAERALVTLVRSGAEPRLVAGALFAAACDYRYLDGGHALDFAHKAIVALWPSWELAAEVLPSVTPALTGGRRMEESNAWRHPIDLVSLAERAFERVPAALERGAGRRSDGWRERLAPVMLRGEPAEVCDALLDALGDGATPADLGGAAAYAAALRLCRFGTSNEFGDWDTAHHTFTFAHAVHGVLRLVPTVETLRGAFDAALSVHLDRFLNVPPAPLPAVTGAGTDEGALLGVFDRQMQVDAAGRLVAEFHDPIRLRAVLGHALLREDAEFHTFQNVEAAFAEEAWARGSDAARHFLVACARFLAAHSPTPRAGDQTFQVARRLQGGEVLHE